LPLTLKNEKTVLRIIKTRNGLKKTQRSHGEKRMAILNLENPRSGGGVPKPIANGREH